MHLHFQKYENSRNCTSITKLIPETSYLDCLNFRDDGTSESAFWHFGVLSQVLCSCVELAFQLPHMCMNFMQKTPNFKKDGGKGVGKDGLGVCEKNFVAKGWWEEGLRPVGTENT